MSQKKVDAYKEAKKTRKEDLAKEKKQKQLRRVLGWIVLVVLVAALGVGLYITIRNIKENSAEDTSAYKSTTYILDDYANMASTEAPTTEAPSTDAPTTVAPAETGK